MTPLIVILVSVPGIQAEVGHDWQQIPNIMLKSATFPPISKNNPNPVVCEFTGTLVKGRFIESALLPGHDSAAFPEEWFQQIVKSIQGHVGQKSMKGRFQIRFNSLRQAISSTEPITLWFKK